MATNDLAAFDQWRQSMLRGAAGPLIQAAPVMDQLAMFDQWRQKMLRGAAAPMTGMTPQAAAAQSPLGRFDQWRQGVLRGAAGPMPGAPAAPATTATTVMGRAAESGAAAQAAQAANAPGAGTLMSRLGGGGNANAIRYPVANPASAATAPSAATAAAGLVDDAAGMAAGAGRVAAAGGRFGALANSSLPWMSMGKSPARLVQMGGMKGIAGAGGLAMTGLTAGGMADSLNIGGENSYADRYLSGALRGAGLGAAVGSVVPVVGTAAGAAVGGLAGGLINVFGPKKDASKEFAKAAQSKMSTLEQLADAYGLDASAKAEMMRGYLADLQASTAFAGGKPNAALADQVAMSYAQQIPAIQQQNRTMAQQAQNALGLQAAIGNYMRPYIDNASAAANTAAGTYQSLADKYAGQPTATYYNQMATNERNFGAKNAQAWAGATQLLPMVSMLSSAQQQAGLPSRTFQSAFGALPVQ